MYKIITFLVLLFHVQSFLWAQVTPEQDILGRDDANVITTATPFLLIAPDSRAGALGDAGAATSPDANSQHWNPSKLMFAESDFSVSLSYTPWLNTLVDDMSLSYLSGYKKLNDRQALGFSLLYFSLGSISFTDETGFLLKEFNPNEFALDASYILLLSKYFSGGVTLRYIYSNLTGGQTINATEESHAGHAVAGDISFYYHKSFTVKDKEHKFALGTHISNMGTKISYTESRQNFIPINWRLGASYKITLDDYNNVTFVTDLNKLLVPTPPVYDPADPTKILAGKDPDVSTAVGIFQSFSDAPNGFQEEMREITYSLGMEYWYSEKFAIRAGYFNEHMTKGNRKYFTLGLGLKLNVFSLDFAYLIPTMQRNPLQNTLRFTLGLNFDKL